MQKIYLDHAATTPVEPQVVEAMIPYFSQNFGNSSSPHFYGQQARHAVEDARDRLARFIGAESKEIVFTSSATEASNHAIFGLAKAYPQKKHILCSSIEHHAVLEPVQELESQGYKIEWLDVDEFGQVDPTQIKNLLKNETLFVAVMHANNEIGTIQPIEEIGKVVKESDAFFLVDAVQTVGHIPVNVNDLNADLLTLSAHKFYGPKGVGGLYVRDGVKIDRFILGGDQERSMRASTVNVPGIVGLGEALKLCEQQMEIEAETQISLRDQFMKNISSQLDDVKINGHQINRLPNNIHLSIARVTSETLLLNLDMAGIAAAAGSACTSGVIELSHVVKALNLDKKYTEGVLRLTLGRSTTEQELDVCLEQLVEIVTRLRK